MSDLFHKDIDRDFIDRVFDTMEAADWHIFQILTKRSSLMRNYLLGRYGESQFQTQLCRGEGIKAVVAGYLNDRIDGLSHWNLASLPN